MNANSVQTFVASSSDYLKKHVYNMHREYTCDFCSLTFGTSSKYYHLTSLKMKLVREMLSATFLGFIHSYRESLNVIFCRWITPFCVCESGVESEVVTKEASTMAPFNATTPGHKPCHTMYFTRPHSSPSFMRVTRRHRITLDQLSEYFISNG